ncbi:cupin domain-containing protein [Streptomyces adustus]|uniref:Cupin domain-containing protein n=2 Tax=Streptomyces adustus TaxID=1609272 RepID=A0A5N8VSF0_9ACTN|nr:cupin domain-containing protein [Streptomyces adustus]
MTGPSFPAFGRGPELEPFWFLGGRARILIPGGMTDFRFSLMEFVHAVGHGPPHHVHEDEDAVWFVLEGEVAFFVGDRRHDLVAGQVAYGPRGVPHSYLVRSPEGARIGVLFSPACIEEFFRANGVPVADTGGLPPEFDQAMVMASSGPFHLRVTGTPPS